MAQAIDCLIIGHNQTDFVEYEKSLRQTGTDSGAYRDLNLSYINYNNTPYHATDTYNLFCRRDTQTSGTHKHLNMLDTFSASIAYLGSYLHRHGFSFD
ncbi:MAG: PhpK family radical SAM P-methyltransferase, partial [bacterium]|nr:PhpK family radical SAM P-methyltransferase [bacterium]